MNYNRFFIKVCLCLLLAPVHPAFAQISTPGTVTVNSTGPCVVIAPTRFSGIRKFSSVCGIRYRKFLGHDCDLIEGNWVCSEVNIDNRITSLGQVPGLNTSASTPTPTPTPDPALSNTIIEITAQAMPETTTLDVSSARAEIGYNYILNHNFGGQGDTLQQPRISTLELFENGVSLGPAHSLHRDIRDMGRGRFSHWNSSLYFSASDNSDPRTNGRVYSFRVNGAAEASNSVEVVVSESAPTLVPVPTPFPTPEPASSPEPAPVPAANCGNTLESRVSSLLSSPDRVGYGRNATGGAGASRITWVTNTNDSGAGSLRNALSQPRPLWIAFDEGLRNETINVGSSLHINDPDVTIDGRGVNGPLNLTLRVTGGTHLLLVWNSNVIITGIRFDGNNSDASGLMVRVGENFWLDHLTTTNFRIDDGLSISMNSRTNSANLATVSNFHTHNTSKGILLGGEPNIHGLKRYVTIFKSQFSAFERNPAVYRGYYAHVYNNYMHSFTWGNGVLCEGRSDTENNVYSGGNNSLNAGFNRYCENTVDSGTGIASSIGNVFQNGAVERGEIRRSKLESIDYPYTLIPVQDVVSHVTRHSGANNAPGVCELWQ